MRTHVEFADPKLFAWRKLAIVEKLSIVVASHNQQPGKKQFRPPKKYHFLIMMNV
jgi:hypothetical protein